MNESLINLNLKHILIKKKPKLDFSTSSSVYFSKFLSQSRTSTEEQTVSETVRNPWNEPPSPRRICQLWLPKCPSRGLHRLGLQGHWSRVLAARSSPGLEVFPHESTTEAGQKVGGQDQPLLQEGEEAIRMVGSVHGGIDYYFDDGVGVDINIDNIKLSCFYYNNKLF